MDLHEIRKRNMAYLGDLYGREGLSTALGYPDTNYVNGVITGYTTLGTKNATRFGERLNLGANWLNEPHQELWDGEGTAPASGIPDRLSAAIDSLEPEDIDLILLLARRLAIKRGAD